MNTTHTTGHVHGYCPMGCGQTLFLGDGGYITCSLLDCPRPDAVATLLDERETEHTVQFDTAGFTILHPLRERISGLLDCGLHGHCASLPGPPDAGPGRYRAVRTGDGWTFEPTA